MPDPSYERKASVTEANDSYLLVEKSSLKFFPPVGESFDLESRGRHAKATVEAENCTCQGPEKPHQHYRISTPGIEPGARYRFTRTDTGYSLTQV